MRQKAKGVTRTAAQRRFAFCYSSATTLLIAFSLSFQSGSAEADGLQNNKVPTLEEACGKPNLRELIALSDGLQEGSSDELHEGTSNDHAISVAQDFTPRDFKSSPANASDQVESLTRQILQRQLEFQKLNTQFRIETALVSRWRQRRVFLYGETSAACTETSLIASISAREQLLRSLKAARGSPKVSNFPVETDDSPDSNDMVNTTSTAPKTSGRVHGRLAAANELQMAGQSVGATGDLFELGLNFAHYCQIRHRNYTPARYRQRVHAVAAELDSLIQRRQQEIAKRNQQESASRVELDSPTQRLDQTAVQQSPDRDGLEACEGKMLSDLRDLSMVDYLEYHAATERFWVLQNTAFLLDFAKNSVGITGNIVSLYGSHRRIPTFAGTSGVCSAVTGALVMLQPVVGRVTGNISGSAARRLVSKELVNVNVRTTDVFESDRKRLIALQERASRAGVTPPGLAQRMPLYAEQAKLMQDMNGYIKNERKRAHNTLVENVTFASLVGPPRIANGITGIVGGYRYYGDSNARERMYLAGNISYACGTGLNMLETARVQASEELRQYRLGKKHMRTKQRFQARLQTLDRLESTVK